MGPVASAALLILATSLRATASVLVSPSEVAAQYSLSTSTTLPFPTSTLASPDAQSFITSQWSLNTDHISNGAADISFVDDPFPNDPTPGSIGNTSFPGPVLQITYPSGSYSQGTGGAQWYSLWNPPHGSGFDSMLLSYEVAFDSNFQWVQGGKLPGLRGGPDNDGCSGGSQPIGNDCFSTRLMWRKGGAGEVYAYMLTPDDLCFENNIVCSSDYGVSISRGSFTFVAGQWSRVTLLVQMNNPPDVANGNIVLYFNDILALTQSNLQLRGATNVEIGGIFFSTFFGGSDSTWATPLTVHTYFQNFQLFGSLSPSNLTGVQVSASTHLATNRGLSEFLLLAWLLAHLW